MHLEMSPVKFQQFSFRIDELNHFALTHQYTENQSGLSSSA